MADETPNVVPPIAPVAPSAGLPPKKDSGKVQPKKETVRINLPPKPTAAPTIKLPTLPPGAPVAAAAAAPAPAAAARPAPSATAGAVRPGAPAAAAAAANRPAARPSPAPTAAKPAAAATVSGLDKGLGIVAAVGALAALGSVLYLLLVVIQTGG